MTAARDTASNDQPLPLTNAADPALPVANLFLGQTYKIPVLRMNGLTQGAYYGDDQQTYTNFPIVRLTYQDSGHVVYARTHQHSTRGTGPDRSASLRHGHSRPAAMCAGSATTTIALKNGGRGSMVRSRMSTRPSGSTAMSLGA